MWGSDMNTLTAEVEIRWNMKKEGKLTDNGHEKEGYHHHQSVIEIIIMKENQNALVFMQIFISFLRHIQQSSIS